MKCTILSTGFEKRRELKNEDERSVSQIKAFLREEIWGLYISGFSDFYVSCELGVPLWSAEIICDLKKHNDIRLHITTPFEEQAVLWSEDIRDRYFQVHSMADSVKIMSVRNYEGCLDDTNKHMTSKSHAVLILCGGQGSDEYRSIKIYRANVKI